jgi:hypothetical protein
MSNTPTRTAVAGRFQSKTGEDLIQYVDTDGNVVVWIDCNGVLYVNSSAVIHGADGAQVCPSAQVSRELRRKTQTRQFVDSGNEWLPLSTICASAGSWRDGQRPGSQFSRATAAATLPPVERVESRYGTCPVTRPLGS